MNKDDFTSIVDQYGSKLYGYLIRFVGNREDAEDILQSLFIAFYQSMDSVDHQKYSSYLYRIAHNKAIDYKKRRSRFINLDTATLAQIAENNPATDEQEERAQKIRRAMSRLKAKEQQALELQFFQNKGYKDIAEIMEITPGAVDSLLVRAKRKLRKYLQDIR